MANKRSKEEETNTKNKKSVKKKKSAMREALKFVAGTSACVGAGALLGAAHYFYMFSMKPVRHDKSRDKDPSERPYVRGRRWMNEHPEREDWYAMTEDGLRIHANFIPSPVEGGDHRYAICVHGYSDTSESVGQYAQHYRDHYGMNVLLPDLRGHGKSEGTYVGYGYHDRLDIILWIDKILERDPEAAIILHGISMGAATVMMTTGEKLPSNVKACVEDAGYDTAIGEFIEVYNNLEQKPPVPAEVIMPLLQRSVTPTLFIHGEADSFIPCRMMKNLFEAASCQKMSMLMPGAEHVMSVCVDPERYWAKVDTFLGTVAPALTVCKD